MSAEAHPAPFRVAARPPRSAMSALWVAAACAVAMVGVWLMAGHVTAFRTRDAAALHDLTLLNRPTLESVGNFLLHLLDPVEFIVWAAVLVCVALAQERPRAAFAVAAVMALAPLSSETLKPLLAQHHPASGGLRIGPASWPSGHSTAALTLAWCAVLASPARTRPVVAAVGIAFAACIGFVLLVLAWHLPSDVLGGYLMATLWTALAVAWLRSEDRREPPRVPAETTPAS